MAEEIVNQRLISVVICTRNEGKYIGNCLRSLRDQNYPQDKIEIIVVDLDSNDETREIAGDFTEKVYNIKEERDLTGIKNFRGAQLNSGVSRASGSIIFYPDADMTFDKNLIENAVELMEKYDALYVPEVIIGRGFFGKVRNFERSFYNATCIDAVRFVKKLSFEAVGGFDEKNIAFGFDDWDFNKSLKKHGYRLGISAARLYHHEEGLSLRGYLHKKSKYAGNFVDYVAKWGRDDPDVRKQFSPWYRLFVVFFEQSKWKRFLSRPHLALGVLALRTLVGFSYLSRKYVKVKI